MSGLPNQGFLAQALQNYAPAFQQGQQVGASLANPQGGQGAPPSLQALLAALVQGVGAGNGGFRGAAPSQPAVLPPPNYGQPGGQQQNPGGQSSGDFTQMLQQLRAMVGNTIPGSGFAGGRIGGTSYAQGAAPGPGQILPM